MRDGHTLIGWGMASGVWESLQQKAAATAVLTVDGKLTVSQRDRGHRHRHLHGHDPDRRRTARACRLEDVTFKLGDSTLPEGAGRGRLVHGASVGSAVKAACEEVRRKAVQLARTIDGSPLAGARSTMSSSRTARFRWPRDPSRAGSARGDDPAGDGQRHRGGGDCRARREAETVLAPHALGDLRRGGGRRGLRHGPRHAGRERDRRRAGSSTRRPRGARSWAASSGASAWRCTRRACLDHALGRFMTHNLADYHVPVNADVPRHRGDLRRGARRGRQPARRQGPGRDRRRRRRGGGRQCRLPRDRQARPAAADHPRQTLIVERGTLDADRLTRLLTNLRA